MPRKQSVEERIENLKFMRRSASGEYTQKLDKTIAELEKRKSLYGYVRNSCRKISIGFGKLDFNVLILICSMLSLLSAMSYLLYLNVEQVGTGVLSEDWVIWMLTIVMTVSALIFIGTYVKSAYERM